MKPSPLGATFGERAAARRGVTDYDAAETSSAVDRSTFAARSGKAVGVAENKAVSKEGTADKSSPKPRRSNSRKS